MRRRDFITLIGSATAAWPLEARAQQQRMQRIGVMVSALAADDPEWQIRGTAFVQGLAQLGWISGRNVRIDYRFGLADPERRRKSAAELIALSPDVSWPLGPGASAICNRRPELVEPTPLCPQDSLPGLALA